MFVEKPFTGFGSGTYQFEYFPFQRQRDMTMISVTSPYNIEKGRGGTAHNEYLLVLSESGLPAALAFLFFILLSVKLAFRHLKTDPAKRGFHAAMLFAFMTFLTHSLFNNFLDTDKAAALFYLAVAWMVYRESQPAPSTTE
jgi:O-antigen ligase